MGIQFSNQINIRYVAHDITWLVASIDNYRIYMTHDHSIIEFHITRLCVYK